MRSRLLQVCALLCVIAATARADTPPKDAPAPPVAQLVLDLSDGSRVIGPPSVDRLKITTKYASLEITLAQVRSIEFNGADHAARMTLQNGDLLSGQIDGAEIAITTIFGKAVIPWAQVRNARVRIKGGSMPEGLVLHYKFDTDEGDRVTDASDAGNNGTVHGATFAKDDEKGGAMAFNGDQQAIIVKDHASLQLQDFTIAAWVKRDNLQISSHSGLSGELFGYGHLGYIMGLHNDGRLILSKVDIGGVFSDCKVLDKAYHHVALTKKGSKVVFYLDGVAFPSQDYDANFEFGTDVAVGARPDNYDSSFLGLIREVTIFNRALSGEEIEQLHDMGK